MKKPREPESDPDRAAYLLVQRDTHVDVFLRGRPRLEDVVALFAELERLTTTTDSELLVLIDESEMLAGLIGTAELRAMMDAWRRSDGLRERSRLAIYAPSDIGFGLNRMAQAFAGNASEGRLKVFRVKDSAQDWLLGGHPS